VSESLLVKRAWANTEQKRRELLRKYSKETLLNYLANTEVGLMFGLRFELLEALEQHRIAKIARAEDARARRLLAYLKQRGAVSTCGPLLRFRWPKKAMGRAERTYIVRRWNQFCRLQKSIGLKISLLKRKGLK
jgi:hypothetical protein